MQGRTTASERGQNGQVFLDIVGLGAYHALRFLCLLFPSVGEVLAAMAHVVTQPCVGCRYTDCVVVCPVECFYEGDKMLYIHPEECIDCEACVAECPVEAIFHEDNVPAEWKSYIELNAEMSPQSKVITEKKKPLADS